jgi:hypothetical protein
MHLSQHRNYHRKIELPLYKFEFSRSKNEIYEDEITQNQISQDLGLSKNESLNNTQNSTKFARVQKVFKVSGQTETKKQEPRRGIPETTPKNYWKEPEELH